MQKRAQAISYNKHYSCWSLKMHYSLQLKVLMLDISLYGRVRAIFYAQKIQ